MSAIPLGQHEGLRLEFKQAEVLGKPETVAREVVAMLNAEGGQVWIGLAEENGYAVRVTPVREAERERGRLLDHLIDTIEPTPRGVELTIDVVAHDDGALLVVRIGESRRKPYAQLVKGDARRYVRRVDDRLRVLSRDELRDLFAGSQATEDGLAEARKALREERNQKQMERRPALWLAIRAVGPVMQIDTAADDLLDLLVFPRESGNRVDGWICVGFGAPTRNAEELRLDDAGGRSTRIRHDGQVRVEVPLGSLAWRDANTIWPYALMEYVVSAFRLTRELYRRCERDATVLAEFALFGLKGWVLRPCSPNTVEYSIGGRAGEIVAFDRQDLLLLQPVECTVSELEANADACALPIIESIYKDFGYRGRPVPREFDPVTKRLNLG